MELNKTEVKAQIKAVEDKGGSAVRITFYNSLGQIEYITERLLVSNKDYYGIYTKSKNISKTFYNFLNDTIITFGVTKISIEECNWYKTVF